MLERWQVAPCPRRHRVIGGSHASARTPLAHGRRGRGLSCTLGRFGPAGGEVDDGAGRDGGDEDDCHAELPPERASRSAEEHQHPPVGCRGLTLRAHREGVRAALVRGVGGFQAEAVDPRAPTCEHSFTATNPDYCWPFRLWHVGDAFVDDKLKIRITVADRVAGGGCLVRGR